MPRLANWFISPELELFFYAFYLFVKICNYKKLSRFCARQLFIDLAACILNSTSYRHEHLLFHTVPDEKLSGQAIGFSG